MPSHPPGAHSSSLRRPDFRRVYVAVSASELGDALQYIALMWFAFEAGGPLGVLAVRLADSVPALVFGLHGGLVADRWDRERVLITTDLIRAGVLVPVAIAGLAGELPLWGLVVAAFLLTSATSYFDPAYGALLPALVDRENVQQANGLVRATAEALSVGGWAVAAGLLAFLPVSLFFAVNAVDVPGLGGDPRRSCHEPTRHARRGRRRPGRARRRLRSNPGPTLPRRCRPRARPRGHDRRWNLDRRRPAARQREPRARRGRLLPRS